MGWYSGPTRRGSGRAVAHVSGNILHTTFGFKSIESQQCHGGHGVEGREGAIVSCLSESVARCPRMSWYIPGSRGSGRVRGFFTQSLSEKVTLWLPNASPSVESWRS